MDDSTPRHAEGGGGSPLRLLKPVTVLADADETPEEALEDWARGLEWVHWLFSSIRHRLDGLYLESPWDASTAKVREIGTHLIRAWQAAEAGDAKALQNLDQALAASWPPALSTRSVKAGELLLRSTRGARYQGVLGRFRHTCDEGQTPGHFLTVWAAVGQFFQLSVANVLAEYLRLEWRMAGREPTPREIEKIATLTSQMLRDTAAELQLMATS
ncbi:MAG TPA: urease accessory UreF family protein, partial [Prosthecobacter sp.]|nr:urease accessory UreF family protein [Prosthecobacter sp.]